MPRRGIQNGIANALSAAFGTTGRVGFNQGFRNRAAGENSIASALKNQAIARQTNQFVDDRIKGLQRFQEQSENDPVIANALNSILVSGKNSNPANIASSVGQFQDFDTKTTALEELGIGRPATPKRQDFSDLPGMGLDPNNPLDREAGRQIRQTRGHAPGFNELHGAQSVGGSQGIDTEGIERASLLLQAAGQKPLTRFANGSSGPFNLATGEHQDPRLFNARVGSEDALGDSRIASGLLDTTKASRVVPESESKVRKFDAETDATRALEDKRISETDNLALVAERITAEIGKIEAQTQEVEAGRKITETARQNNLMKFITMINDPLKGGSMQAQDGTPISSLPIEKQAQAFKEIEQFMDSGAFDPGVLGQEPVPQVEEPGFFESLLGSDEPPQAQQSPQQESIVPIPGVGQFDVSVFDANLSTESNENLRQFAVEILPRMPAGIQEQLRFKIEAELQRRMGG